MLWVVSKATLLGDTPALFVSQFTRRHPCTLYDPIFFLMRMSDGVEMRRECGVVGRAVIRWRGKGEGLLGRAWGRESAAAGGAGVGWLARILDCNSST